MYQCWEWQCIGWEGQSTNLGSAVGTPTEFGMSMALAMLSILMMLMLSLAQVLRLLLMLLRVLMLWL